MPRLALGIGLAWAGYTLAYYGFQRILSGNNTILQLAWPGKYQPVPKDSSSSPQSPQGSTPNPAGGTIPIP